MKKIKNYFIFIFLMCVNVMIFAQNTGSIGTWEGVDDLNRRVVLEIGQRNWNMWVNGSFFGSGTYRISDRFTHLILSSGREYGAFFITVGDSLSVQRLESNRAFFLNRQDRSSNQTTTPDSRPFITVINNTGYTIWHVYIKTSSSTNWGDDILRSDQVLNNGQSVGIRLGQSLNVTNRYDICIIDLDGDTYTKWNVLLTNNARIAFTFDDFD